jgi:hypothetical protein
MLFIYLDPRLIDTNNLKDSQSKHNQILVIILMIPIVFITCIICCLYQYNRRHGDYSFEPFQRETPQLPELSTPQLLIDTISRWKNIRHTLPSSINTTRVPQPTTVRTAIITSTEEPPAYAGMAFI